ncbi:MAG: NAD(P)H-dependent oxidoreductase [Candidatus Eisenbacteria bacterium]|uniref:NAD(P)H-dependent oxidoreductase n=1 Tax=Eiseniibacteriota bacterium TaxID=2212470 RepID=A0A956RQL5_UNCEI|nr:NAD(P)H-dependent oxidoreductase [Candidatus Eisenbacteria bacterium]
MEPLDKIRIAVVIGTRRPGNYTSMAARLVVDELERDADVAVEVFDPQNRTLPFPGEEPASADALALQKLIRESAGVVLATPEYHGSLPAMMKLILENLGFPSALTTKPVALLGVAAGAIGAIKSLEQLRSIGSHVGAIVLPGAVSVAGVQKAFDRDGTCLDPAVEKRVRSVATGLLGYLHRHVCPALTLERMVREPEA